MVHLREGPFVGISVVHRPHNAVPQTASKRQILCESRVPGPGRLKRIRSVEKVQPVEVKDLVVVTIGLQPVAIECVVPQLEMNALPFERSCKQARVRVSPVLQSESTHVFPEEKGLQDPPPDQRAGSTPK